jgi:hypothetical protein
MLIDLTEFAGISFAEAIRIATPIQAWKLGLKNLEMTDEVAEAVLTNGLVSLSKFVSLTDEEVTHLIKSIRKPGGADKGQPLPIIAERRLKGLWWMWHFKLMVARDPSVRDMTGANADD